MTTKKTKSDFIPSLGHIGTFLEEEFLVPGKIKPTKLAEAAGINRGVLSGVLAGKRPLSVEAGVRLSLALGLSPGFLLNVQANYTRLYALKLAEELGDQIVPVVNAAA